MPLLRLLLTALSEGRFLLQKNNSEGKRIILQKVVLRPLMVVAGDHANNDMAGDDEDLWKSMFDASGKFDSIDTQIAGLGEIDAIQQLYVDVRLP